MIENNTLNLASLLPLILLGAVLLGLFIFTKTGGQYNLDRVKRKTVGDGQHGTARFATTREIQKTTHRISYTPWLWRQKKNLPDVDGLVISLEQRGKRLIALVDTDDNHTLIVAGPGGGKTTGLMIPNIEYALAAEMSFISTDSKGDILRYYKRIAEEYYGYTTYVIDFRNPTLSQSYNMMNMVNKYFDEYKETGEIHALSLAERHAKIIGSIVVTSIANAGQNAYFYQSAEGLISAVCLLVTEFCTGTERHIVTVFKIVLDMLAEGKTMIPGTKQKKSRFKEIMELLPENHKAKWFAGSALNSAGQAFASVVSTAISELISFIDTETEQILCFDSPVTIEDICEKKVAVFIVFPEEDKTKHKLVSLMLTQLYQDAFAYVDRATPNRRLDRRLYFLEDEFGIYPKQENVTEVFAAARSRNIIVVPAIQALAQLNEKYGNNGQKIIMNCCQSSIFGGFSPLSEDAEFFSKTLGTQTVASGSVSNSSGERNNNKSRNISMISRPLMTADELRNMPMFQWVVTRKSSPAFLSDMPRFSDWGIELDKLYYAKEEPLKKVAYGTCDEIERNIMATHKPVFTVNIPDDEIPLPDEPPPQFVSPDSY